LPDARRNRLGFESVGFITATYNRIPTQASDLNDALHTTAAPLLGQDPGKPASVLFVQREHDAIDGPMFLGNATVRVLVTFPTAALMQLPSLLVSWHTISLTVQVELCDIATPSREASGIL
jgi:hypothetical protein